MKKLQAKQVETKCQGEAQIINDVHQLHVLNNKLVHVLTFDDHGKLWPSGRGSPDSLRRSVLTEWAHTPDSDCPVWFGDQCQT